MLLAQPYHHVICCFCCFFCSFSTFCSFFTVLGVDVAASVIPGYAAIPTAATPMAATATADAATSAATTTATDAVGFATAIAIFSSISPLEILIMP